jgi:intracellular sulfur oxidation DsrE/DsrF family protein
MMTTFAALFLMILAVTPGRFQWAAPRSPIIPAADGYVPIPHAAVMPEKARIYRAIYDATRAPALPTELVPALNMAGSELNVLGATGVPIDRARFVVVFHGDAMGGILDPTHYRARFGVDNPNLAVLAGLRRAGVELFVCGQNLASERIDPRWLSPDVRVASDALIVLMTYQAEGYALMSF